ncbi:ribonuclease Z [Eremococcus coleocola]|uniref:Ribonuclease Z n=1 Tax=Eremococcus coleocola ACS-139-V-Col8 TaxID=908337 RepID=E4KM21_9LACT|nr:ribonuclease Z [Eremococcus coleocola]EFR32073.1 ribonuclease Z [Eremococcus coleocola ACS-139-V-Col8]
MELLFLGTGAGIPSKNRNVSSMALKLLNQLNQVWLFDCGEGTQHQILHTSLKPRKVSKIFITHMHGDHIFGLPGFLSSRSFQGGEEPVTIYGPQGIKDYVLMCLKLSKSNLGYPLIFEELSDQGGKLDLGHGWQAEYLPLNHGILSFGFRIKEPDTPGQLLVDDLKAQGIPAGPIYGRLKAGETVQLEDGRLLDGKDFIAPAQAGHVLTYIGDTRPNANNLILAKDADVLIYEGTHDGSLSQMANQYYHSTSDQGATLAKEAGVKQVYLNHISSRYLSRDVQVMEQAAQKIFPKLHIVRDLEEINLDSVGG